MFSPTLTKQKLEALARSGTELIEYPIPYVQSAVAHFKSLENRDKKNKPQWENPWKRPLTPDELKFIRNEQLYSQISWEYWSRRYFPVANAETLKYEPYVPNDGQKFLEAIFAQLEEENLPMLILLLKVRQMGGTTKSAGVQLYSCTCLQNINAIVGSSDPEKSAKMFDSKFVAPLERLPIYMLPPGMQWVDSGENRLWCDRTNVKLTLAHGSSTDDMGRGDTFNRIHGSEIRDWDRPRRHIHNSLLPAVHLSSETFGIFESTPRGRGDDWHNMWLEAKEGWPKKQSIICPVFIPPYLAQDIYPTDGWLNLIPIPPNWEPSEATKQYAAQGAEHIRNSTLLKGIFPRHYEIPRRHLWWYEFEYNKALRADRLGEWMAEHPPSDLQAFQAAGASIFSPILITTYDNQVALPRGVFTVLGDDILEDSTVDRTEWLEEIGGRQLRPIPVSHEFQGVGYKWWLQPLKFTSYSEVHNPENKLWIWEWPQENHEYCVSLDTAGGEDKDRTVLEVIRKATATERPVQVAEFASAKIGGLDIWPIWILLLKLYSVRSVSGLNLALASPEMNFDGPAALQKIMSLGWSNVYIRKENEKAEQNFTNRSLLGFKTTPGTRPHLVTYLKNFLKSQRVKINSPWLIDEMRDFVKKVNVNTNKVREEHDTSKHDDRLFALAIGLVCLHDLDIYGAESPDWKDLNSARELLTAFATSSTSGLTHSAKKMLDNFYGIVDNSDEHSTSTAHDSMTGADFVGDLAELRKRSDLDYESALVDFAEWDGMIRA